MAPIVPADVCPPDDPKWGRHPTRRSVVHSTTGMVSCTQPLAARAGIKVLEQGGNAADGAVAVAAALNVTEPMATGIGGDLFCLYYDASTQKVRALNATGRSSGSATLEQLRTDMGLKDGEKAEMPSFGAQSVTVPGAAAGWVDAVGLFGSHKLSMSQVLAPAIELAEKGYPVSQVCANLWSNWGDALKGASDNYAELLKSDPGAPKGCRPPMPGELFRNPNLGKVFRKLAEHGKKGFYEGEIAEQIVKVVQSKGGYLTLDDLKHHSELPPDETVPISLEVSGLGIKNPVRLWQHRPNSDGLVALIALGLLQQLEKAGHIKPFTPADHNTVEYLHALIECLRLAFADATWYVADDALNPAPIDALLDPAYLSARIKDFTPTSRRPLPPPTSADELRPAPHGSNTVYFSVTDGAGNACSFVNSNYDEFGSRLIPAGTGFALQNRGAGFALAPPHHPNAYAPRKRPFHTLTAPMLTDARDGALVACSGCMGKFMQPQGHVQLLLNMLACGMDPQEALDAPRIAIEVLPESERGTRGDKVFVEEGMDERVVEGLRALGHECVVVGGFARKFFGRGQIIRRSEDEGQLIWSAGSDQRGDGFPMPL